MQAKNRILMALKVVNQTYCVNVLMAKFLLKINLEYKLIVFKKLLLTDQIIQSYEENSFIYPNCF